jgi:hypothetical protein
MKLKLFVLVAIAGMLVLSCKKKEASPTATSSGSGGGGGGGGNSFAPTNATTFSGIFSVGNYTYSILSSSFTSVFDNGNAYFSTTPQSYMNSAAGVTVNAVYLNGDPLNYYTTQNYYGTSSLTSASETWSVDGANGIPSFTFTNPNLIPSASGFASVPSTISKAAGFTLNINSVSNITDGFFIIDDGSGGPNASIVHTVTSGNNMIAVSSASLAALVTGTNASIYLALQNNKAYSYSGKNYQFRKEKQLILSGVTINP